MRMATTMTRTTTMIAVARPLLSTVFSDSSGGRDHECGAAHFDYGDLSVGGDAAGIGGDGKPAFIEEARVPGMILVADRPEGERGLTDQVVGRARHCPLGHQAAGGDPPP